ncbi:hypothetical protein [Micromonospora sp. MW-13]|nr:hypothetical protein [Micromonospora sp. MW-13]
MGGSAVATPSTPPRRFTAFPYAYAQHEWRATEVVDAITGA